MRGREAIFDVRIMDTESKLYRNRPYLVALEAQEKERKDKYLRPCLEQRKDFIPLVYSVDGILGREAKSTDKRVASYLGAKWRKSYLEMFFNIRVRMALTVVGDSQQLADQQEQGATVATKSHEL